MLQPIPDRTRGEPAVVDFVVTYLDELRQCARLVDADQIACVVSAIVDGLERDATILICGNGGSATTAAHMALDVHLTWYRTTGRPSRVRSLGDSASTISALGNDLCFEDAFAAQIEAGAMPDDVLVLLSVSATSTNIVRAARTARALGVRTVALLGQPGPLAKHADVSAIVGGGDYGISEDLHLAVNHILVRAISGDIAGRRARPPEKVGDAEADR